MHFTEVEWMSDGWGLRRLSRGPGSRNVGPIWRARSDLKKSFSVCISRKQDNLCLSQNQSNKSTTDLLRWSASSWLTMVMKILMWVESMMAVLPKSPGYIRKWLANTESAEVPLCAQALIGSMVSSVGYNPWLLRGSAYSRSSLIYTSSNLTTLVGNTVVWMGLLPMTKLVKFCTQMCRALSKRNCSSANSDNAVLASTLWTPWPTSRGKRSREPPWMRFVGPEFVVVIWQIFSGGRLHNCWQGRPDRSSLSWDHKNGKLSVGTQGFHYFWTGTRNWAQTLGF